MPECLQNTAPLLKCGSLGLRVSIFPCRSESLQSVNCHSNGYQKSSVQFFYGDYLRYSSWGFLSLIKQLNVQIWSAWVIHDRHTYKWDVTEGDGSKAGFLKLAFQQERPRNLLVRSWISPNVIKVILWVLLSSQTILKVGSLEINPIIPSLVPGNGQSFSNSHCQKWFFFLAVICQQFQGSVTSNSEQESYWFGGCFGVGGCFFHLPPIYQTLWQWDRLTKKGVLIILSQKSLLLCDFQSYLSLSAFQRAISW